VPAGAAGDNDRQIAVNLLSAAGSPATAALIALASEMLFEKSSSAPAAT